MSPGELFAPPRPELTPPPRPGQYRVLYPDAPWPERGGGKIKRGADRHYDLMTVADIVQHFRVFGGWAAADAHLYAWATNNYLPAAFECVKAAGFRYVTMVTWVKDRPGLGQYYRGRTEHCLFAVRGRLPYLVAPNGKRAQGETVLYAPDPADVDPPPPADLPEAIEATRGPHSAKPAIFRQTIERVSGAHGPMLELYARTAAAGWDAWGNQAPPSTP